jgi:hypothetical protein
MFFRKDVDEAEFRAHARANYTVGQPIDPEGIRHPVWVHEAATMNLETWRTAAEPFQELDEGEVENPLR